MRVAVADYRGSLFRSLARPGSFAEGTPPARPYLFGRPRASFGCFTNGAYVTVTAADGVCCFRVAVGSALRVSAQNTASPSVAVFDAGRGPGVTSWPLDVTLTLSPTPAPGHEVFSTVGSQYWRDYRVQYSADTGLARTANRTRVSVKDGVLGSVEFSGLRPYPTRNLTSELTGTVLQQAWQSSGASFPSDLERWWGYTFKTTFPRGYYFWYSLCVRLAVQERADVANQVQGYLDQSSGFHGNRAISELALDRLGLARQDMTVERYTWATTYAKTSSRPVYTAIASADKLLRLDGSVEHYGGYTVLLAPYESWPFVASMPEDAGFWAYPSTSAFVPGKDYVANSSLEPDNGDVVVLVKASLGDVLLIGEA